jgi:hypothetical protein
MRLVFLLLLWPAVAAAQSQEEVTFIRALFSDLQPVSFAKGVEHCGFLGRDASGALQATEPVAGTVASCTSPWPEGIEVLASYHTHGDFEEGYWGELPSLADLASDRALGIDGWIATPGGRLWFNDTGRAVTKQVCSVGCLPMSRGYTKAEGDIAKGYTLPALRARMER